MKNVALASSYNKISFYIYIYIFFVLMYYYLTKKNQMTKAFCGFSFCFSSI